MYCNTDHCSALVIGELWSSFHVYHHYIKLGQSSPITIAPQWSVLVSITMGEEPGHADHSLHLSDRYLDLFDKPPQQMAWIQLDNK